MNSVGSFVPGSSVRPRLDPSDRVQVQNQRQEYPVPLQEEQGGRLGEARRRHDQVLLQRGRIPYAGKSLGQLYWLL